MKQIPWLWCVGRTRKQRLLDGQTGFANSFSLCAVTKILDGDFPFFFLDDEFDNGDIQKTSKKGGFCMIKGIT